MYNGIREAFVLNPDLYQDFTLLLFKHHNTHIIHESHMNSELRISGCPESRIAYSLARAWSNVRKSFFETVSHLDRDLRFPIRCERSFYSVSYRADHSELKLQSDNCTCSISTSLIARAIRRAPDIPTIVPGLKNDIGAIPRSRYTRYRRSAGGNRYGNTRTRCIIRAFVRFLHGRKFGRGTLYLVGNKCKSRACSPSRALISHAIVATVDLLAQLVDAFPGRVFVEHAKITESKISLSENEKQKTSRAFAAADNRRRNVRRSFTSAVSVAWGHLRRRASVGRGEFILAWASREIQPLFTVQ